MNYFASLALVGQTFYISELSDFWTYLLALRQILQNT